MFFSALLEDVISLQPTTYFHICYILTGLLYFVTVDVCVMYDDSYAHGTPGADVSCFLWSLVVAVSLTCCSTAYLKLHLAGVLYASLITGRSLRCVPPGWACRWCCYCCTVTSIFVLPAVLYGNVWYWPCG